MYDLSWLNPTPHATAVYASCSALLPPHATLASRRPATALPGLDFHQLIAPALAGAFVAVGTCVSPHAPRTEPYVRLSRIRLPPRVCDGIAIAGPRMKDGRFREPGLRQLRHPFPRGAILLAATPQRAPPEVAGGVRKDVQGTTIGRHGVVVEVTADYRAEPFPLRGDRQVHAPSQYRPGLPAVPPHAIRPGLPFGLD